MSEIFNIYCDESCHLYPNKINQDNIQDYNIEDNQELWLTL